MSRQQTIAVTIDRLKRSVPPNEAAVKAGFVDPLLQALGWDTADFEQVHPEFSIHGKRADLALCHPKGQPQVFVEIKQSLTFEQGVDQLLAYAFNQGVRIAVLTDGRRWSFYLPSGAGSFGDRRFYHLDLLQRTPEEIDEYLGRYLLRERIQSGAAIRAAMEDCELASRRRQVEDAIPRAWQALLRDCDEYVSLQLKEKVRDMTGSAPSAESIEEFLRSRAADFTGRTSAIPTTKAVAAEPTPMTPPSVVRPERIPVATNSTASATGGLWFAIDGTRQTRRAAIAVVRDALIGLEQLKPGFIGEYEAQARHGRTRRWVTKDRAALYERPDLCEECAELLIDGWWLGTNYNNLEKRKMLLDIQAVAQRLGVDFEFSIGEPA